MKKTHRLLKILIVLQVIAMGILWHGLYVDLCDSETTDGYVEEAQAVGSWPA